MNGWRKGEGLEWTMLAFDGVTIKAPQDHEQAGPNPGNPHQTWGEAPFVRRSMLQAVRYAVSCPSLATAGGRQARRRACGKAWEEAGLGRITASSIPRLPSLKFSLSFLYKSLHTFSHIFSGEEQEEILAFDLQPLI
jgi:hypothetical protein